MVVVLLGVLLLLPGLSRSWAAEDEPKEDGIIKVTANKIEEDVTDVPQSITVIDEITLEEKGIKDIPDVIREIPNMRR
ncbi:MAG TPA: hypothetical protein ENN66_08660 [Proteobacteria bacterium]|nr:hypothetical protein [Pseudomonadota bacterium]